MGSSEGSLLARQDSVGFEPSRHDSPGFYGEFFVPGGTAQPIDPFMAIAERQPPATAADRRQVDAAHRRADPREDLLPRKMVPRFQTKPPKDNPILVNHVRFRQLAVECTTGGLLLVRAGGTHCIGSCHDLDSGFGLIT